MMAIYVGYEIATAPSGRAMPGAQALMSYYLGRFADKRNPRPANLGIYNPKRLGSGWSIHAEGRACDLGTAPYSTPAWGWEWADLLRLNSAELGIQCVIFDRKIWSGAYPHAGWRNYSGSNPHTGHLHTELSRAASRNLTVERLHEVLGTAGVVTPSPSPSPSPSPQSEQEWRKGIIKKMKTVNLRGVTSNSRTWVRGAGVRRLQGALLADGYGPAGLVAKHGRPDGIAGPATRRLLGDAQRKHNAGDPKAPSNPDYVAGSKTWGGLLGVK